MSAVLTVRNEFINVVKEYGITNFDDLNELPLQAYVKIKTAAHLCLKCTVNPGTCILCFVVQPQPGFSKMSNSHIMSRSLWEITSGKNTPIHIPGVKDATSATATKMMLCTGGNACEQYFASREKLFKSDFLLPVLNCNGSITIKYREWLFFNVVSLIWRGMLENDYISSTNRSAVNTDGSDGHSAYSQRFNRTSESDVTTFPWQLERTLHVFLRSPTVENARTIRMIMACSDCQPLESHLFINEVTYAASPAVSLIELKTGGHVLIFSVTSVKFLVCLDSVSIDDDLLDGGFPISSAPSEVTIPPLELRVLPRMFVVDSIGRAGRRSLGAGQRGYIVGTVDPALLTSNNIAAQTLYTACVRDMKLLVDTLDGRRELSEPLLYNFIEQSGYLRWRTTGTYPRSHVAKGRIEPVKPTIVHVFTRGFESDIAKERHDASVYVHGYKVIKANDGQVVQLLMCVETAVHVLPLPRLILSGWKASYLPVDRLNPRLKMESFVLNGEVWSEKFEESVQEHYESLLRSFV